MSNKEPDLIQAIDATAHKLLRKIGGDSKLDEESSAIFVEQVKAFDVVVRWASARKALLPVEDKSKDSRFAGIKREFHVGSQTRDRRSSSTAKTESSPTVVAFPGADGEPDGDDSSDD